MSSCSFLFSFLTLVLVVHSLAQTPTESSSDLIHDITLKRGSTGTEQSNQFYGHGYPSNTASTDDKLLNLTGTILDILQSQEPRCTPRPAPSDDRSDTAATEELLNLTGTILDILQSQESRCTPRPAPIGDPSSSASTDKLLNLTGTILDILQHQDSRYNPRPASSIAPGYPRDCAEIQASGQNTTGMFLIYPDGAYDPFFIWCDMETDGGGWTVFQRRQDGSVDFYLEWADYKYGFGSVSSEHWLGNDNIHRLALQKNYELRVDLEDFEGQTRYARYSSFSLEDEEAKYTLTLGEYSGDAEDSLSYHSGQQFTTKDRDNDKSPSNCASASIGAWWYNHCRFSNLNGLYLHGTNSQDYQGVVWSFWLGANYSLKKTEMKIRPVSHGMSG